MPTISKGSNTAWMLRQGGDAFGVIHHFYVMDDEDLSSEAEVAAFIIATESKDQDLAKYILDAWMALLIENSVPYDGEEAEIEGAIEEAVSILPYSFQYPLSVTELIKIHRECNHYDNVGSLYDFVDDVRSEKAGEYHLLQRYSAADLCDVSGNTLSPDGGSDGGQRNSESSASGNWYRRMCLLYQTYDLAFGRIWRSAGTVCFSGTGHT